MRRDRLHLTRRSVVGLVAAGVMALAACGGSSDAAPSSVADSGESIVDGETASSDALSGIVRDPAPVVDGVTLPSLTDPGTDVEFRARPGGVQVVYFGFTNCPDVCPTTLADYRGALNRIERDDPGNIDLIDTVMVGVDPGRDNDVLPAYVSTFVPGAIAAGTLDEELLASAGEPFGASWEVRTLDDGTIEVDHSPFLYAVDDQGELVLTWQFGASPTDMANDLELLLDRASA